MLRFKIISVFLFLSFVSPAGAQSVGVVLSGGGAKGLYHIGVLQALEENNIPIDYISGTSMGAILGGLYAAGYTPAQMLEIFRSDRVNYWMSGRIEPKYHFHFKQPRKTAAMITLRLDAEKLRGMTLQIPNNIINPNQIDMGFVEFFSAVSASAGGDFDSLFIPFRCVASDIVAGKETTFSKGDMGKAIRASMAIPLVFPALAKDSTLYFDGGLFNNFPWQVLVEDFNPDILIGSKCTDLIVPTENNIRDQILGLMMMRTDYDLPSENDISIGHVLTDVSVVDFQKVDYIVQKGYEQTMAQMPEILKKITRRADSTELAERRNKYRESLPELIFDDYSINGMTEEQRLYVEHMLHLGREGNYKTFTLDDFKTEYFRLLSEGDITADFPGVFYNSGTSRFSLGLNLSSKPRLKIMIGGNISSTSMNQAYIGVEYRTINRRSRTYSLDGYFSALYTSVYSGLRTDFYRRFPFAIDYGFNYNYYNYFKSNFGLITTTSDIFYSKMEDSFVTSALSIPAGRLSVLSLRVNLGRNNWKYFQQPNYSDDDRMDRTQFTFGGAKLELERNGLNYIMYPTRGLRQLISAAYILGEEEYFPGSFAPENARYYITKRRGWVGAQYSRENYFNLGRWFTLGYLLKAHVSNHPDFSNSFATNLSMPSFTPTPHSKFIYIKDFRNNSFVAAGLIPTIEFNSRFYLQNSVYLFGALGNDIKDNFLLLGDKMRVIINSSLVYQTPVGPASLTLSKYNVQSRKNWFLTFNLGYTIFNDRGLFY